MPSLLLKLLALFLLTFTTAVKRVLPDPRTEPTVTVPKAAELLGISRGSGYAAAESGELPVLRVGKRLLVPTYLLLRMLGVEHPDEPHDAKVLDEELTELEPHIGVDTPRRSPPRSLSPRHSDRR